VRPLLVRTPGSKRQAGLARAQRRANVRGAFAARSEAPPRVVLVDDVYTTGATASACSTALRRAGARRVDVVCLARAVR
jgi:predicted amidophosphoribosyltransferase